MREPTRRYALCCRRPLPDGTTRVLTESHRVLPDALEAMTDHQQRRWTSVALTAHSEGSARMSTGLPSQLTLWPEKETR